MQPGHPRLRPLLGLESSCDETAAAILDGDGRDSGRNRAEPAAEHAAFGGVVPEIAARAHLAHMPDLVRDVLREAGLRIAELGRRRGDDAGRV